MQICRNLRTSASEDRNDMVSSLTSLNCIKYVDGSDDQKISCVADLVTCAQDACAHAHRMAKLEAGGLQKHI